MDERWNSEVLNWWVHPPLIFNINALFFFIFLANSTMTTSSVMIQIFFGYNNFINYIRATTHQLKKMAKRRRCCFAFNLHKKRKTKKEVCVCLDLRSVSLPRSQQLPWVNWWNYVKFCVHVFLWAVERISKNLSQSIGTNNQDSHNWAFMTEFNV